MLGDLQLQSCPEGSFDENPRRESGARAHRPNASILCTTRVRSDAPLNQKRPGGYYGSSPVAYTDYSFLKPQTAEIAGNTGQKQTHA